MFETLKRKYLKSKLKDERFEFLFEPPLFDEYVAFDCETTGLNPKKMRLSLSGPSKLEAIGY